MTEYEARKVAAILASAEDGRTATVVRLTVIASRAFPEFDWFRLVAEANVDSATQAAPSKFPAKPVPADGIDLGLSDV
jgi:hypothetical protein